jgi:hypothetical protein
METLSAEEETVSNRKLGKAEEDSGCSEGGGVGGYVYSGIGRILGKTFKQEDQGWVPRGTDYVR